VRSRPPVPRTALQVPGELAESLGVSVDFVNEHVRPELRLVRRGRLVLVSVDEVARWLERSAARTLGDRE
jgi:excisionase family DNA binding protein